MSGDKLRALRCRIGVLFSLWHVSLTASSHRLPPNFNALSTDLGVLFPYAALTTL
jgi:hypothetical protein